MNPGKKMKSFLKFENINKLQLLIDFKNSNRLCNGQKKSEKQNKFQSDLIRKQISMLNNRIDINKDEYKRISNTRVACHPKLN